MNQETIVIGQLSLAGLFLVLLTVYLNHLLANSRDKIKTRKEQGHALSMAFEPEIQALTHTDQDCRFIMTEEAYQRHEAAIRIFTRYLSWVDRLRLKILWHRLAMVKIDEKTHMPFYEQYADCGSLDKRRKARPRNGTGSGLSSCIDGLIHLPTDSRAINTKEFGDLFLTISRK
jgi:hypothetical protein